MYQHGFDTPHFPVDSDGSGDSAAGSPAHVVSHSPALADVPDVAIVPAVNQNMEAMVPASPPAPALQLMVWVAPWAGFPIPPAPFVDFPIPPPHADHDYVNFFCINFAQWWDGKPRGLPQWHVPYAPFPQFPPNNDDIDDYNEDDDHSDDTNNDDNNEDDDDADQSNIDDNDDDNKDDDNDEPER